MTLAKAVVTGTVFRAPEKRFTQNNVPVSSFVLNIGDREEMLLRVIVKRAALDEAVICSLPSTSTLSSLERADTASSRAAERRIYEIDANTIEPMGSGSAPAAKSSGSGEDIVKFSQEEFSDELIGEDEIPF